MTEAVLIASGFVLAVCFGAAGACWWFLTQAKETLSKAANEAQTNLADLRAAALTIQDAHNALTQTVAEHGQALERIKTDVASKALGRGR